MQVQREGSVYDDLVDGPSVKVGSEKNSAQRRGLEVEKCQARALSTNRHSEGLLHPPSLKSLSPPQLQDVLVLVLRPMLVLSLLSLPKNHLGPYQISSSLWTDHHAYHKCWGSQSPFLCSSQRRHP